jgi:Transposase DDE domain group 1
MCLLGLENQECSKSDPANPQKALTVKLPDVWSRATPIFDEKNLVSCAGLVPLLGLAERAGLSELIAERVRFKASRVRSAGVNPAGKLTSVVAGMAAEADSIDDLDVICSGGMPRLFGGVYSPATLGQFLREFTHGHTRQLASVLRAHLVNLVKHTNLLPGIGERVYVDIDSLLRPVFGHAKQGASYGHTKIAGKQVLRKGLSPLATTISTERGAPVVAGIWLRAGRAGSGKGAASMVIEAVNTARAAGASGEILVRGDSAYGNHTVVRACLKAGARFSLVLVKNPTVTRAIGSIPDQAWMPVQYRGAVLDPDTGGLISDAEVAETAFTAFASTHHRVTARLIVRRVRDRGQAEELFPVWRYHRS